jgi:hypothetical protein
MENKFNKKIGATILRAVLGFLILKDFIIYYNNREYLFDKNGIVSYETYTDITNYLKSDWLYVDFGNKNNITFFLIIGVIFSLLLFLGFFKKLSAIVLFLLLLIFKHRNIYLLDGGDNVIWILLPFMSFIDSYSFSKGYDNLINKISVKFKPYSIILSKYFSFTIIIQLSIIYIFASLHKLQGEVWLNGTALYYVLKSEDFNASFINNIIAQSTYLVAFLTWLTIIFQLTFPFLIWNKKTKLIIILMGIFFHIGIFIMLRVDNFSFIMIGAYAILLYDNEYLNLFSKFKKLKK